MPERDNNNRNDNRRGLMVPTNNDQEDGGKRSAPLTSGDLRYILEANKKSVEIYLEVEKQNEDVLEKLEELITLQKETASSIKGIDRSFFQLKVILGTIGTGTIIGVLKIILGH